MASRTLNPRRHDPAFGEGDAHRSPLAGGRVAPSAFHETILDSMTSGVMSLDANGIVRAFNPAAVSILALQREAVVGSAFAQVFIPREGFDEFNEVVLASVYGEGVTRDRRVVVKTSGRTLPLVLTTSFLTGAERGVVAVFSDVSETEALRIKEQALTGQVERQHEELRNAYRQLESRNGELGSALRKVQIIRMATTAALAALFIGIVLHGFGVSFDLFGAADAAPGSALAGHEHVVETGRIESVIPVPGEVAPLVEVPIRSPLDGAVAAVHVNPGQHVTAGARLLELDTEAVKVERRNAQVKYLKALGREEELESWSSSTEVARARRAVTKARIAFATGRSQVEQAAFLYETGLVARTKKVSAEREQRTRELDLESTQRDLEAVIAEGGENHKVAVLETRNARAERDRLDRLIEGAIVTAPVDGVILGTAGREPALAAGTVVKSGQHLVTISRGRSLAVRGRVDEIRVREIAVGDRVRISGAAFPGVALDGRIAQVSAHAVQIGGKALPSFAVVAAVENLTGEQGQIVRLGMSATMDIVVYERDDAVLVPVAAVDPRSRTVELVDGGTGARRTVPVKTGRTTANAVEILEGVSPGDVVLVP